MPTSRRTAPAVCAAVLLALTVLTGCAGHQPEAAGHHPAAPGPRLVPWTDQPVGGAELAQFHTAPACSVDVLHLPASQERWGGVWKGAVSGYFVIVNTGHTTCELPPPSQVRSLTRAGARTTFGVGSLHATAIVLRPGGRVQVQVSAPYGCGKPLARSSAFTLDFPTGILRIPDARMAVQCGGSLVDFSARNARASATGTTRATPVSRLHATVSRMPASVTSGDPVTYAITLTNPTSTPIGLHPCPAYQEGIKGQPSSVKSYRLNCGAVDRIGAHSSVSYAMRLPLSTRVEPGPAVLDWQLQLPADPISQGQFASANTQVK